MKKVDPRPAEQIAQAAIVFQQQRTGHEPQSVAVVLSGDTLLITLHGALSPAEKALALSPEGAARVLEIRGMDVKVGFEVDPDVPVHRSEVWERTPGTPADLRVIIPAEDSSIFRPVLPKNTVHTRSVMATTARMTLPVVSHHVKREKE
jgi:hypothetical protein